MLPFFSFVKFDDIEVLEKVLSLSRCYVVRGGEVPKVEQWLMHHFGAMQLSGIQAHVNYICSSWISNMDVSIMCHFGECICCSLFIRK